MNAGALATNDQWGCSVAHSYDSAMRLGGTLYKDRDCGELRAADVGKQVNLAGWVHRRRDHGGLIFLDLRDRSGLVQVVVNPELAPDAHAASEAVRNEWVLHVVGEVTRRPAGTEKPVGGHG